MIKIIPIASGSTGNCLYLNIDNHQILIDFGITLKKIKEALSTNNVDINDIEYGFITHKHTDHIKGLKVIKDHLVIPYYTSNSCAKYLNKKYQTDIFKGMKVNDEILLDDLKVNTIRVSHDVETVAYTFQTKNHKVGYATDLGFYNEKLFKALVGCDVVVVESNHDIDMLDNGPYSQALKDRIESDYGHLSNFDCAYLINGLLNKGTNNFLLAHLSKENNTPELAVNEINKLTKGKANLYVCPIYGSDLLNF